MNILFRNGISIAVTILTFGILVNSVFNTASARRSDDFCRPSCETVELEQSVNLSWTAPSTRTDGGALSLSELEGYRIYYGTDTENLNPLVDLNDSSITSHSITDLSPGLYYFTVTAYDYEGLESSFSQVVSKEIL